MWDGAAVDGGGGLGGQTVVAAGDLHLLEVAFQLGVGLDLLSQLLTQGVVLEVHLLELLTEGLVVLAAVDLLHGLQVLLDEVADDLLLLDWAAGGEEVDDEVISVARLQDGRWLDDAPRGEEVVVVVGVQSSGQLLLGGDLLSDLLLLLSGFPGTSQTSLLADRLDHLDLLLLLVHGAKWGLLTGGNGNRVG